MGLLDLLFPPRCAACAGAGWPLCERCLRDLPVITPPLCRRCGRPTEAPAATCRDCPPPGIDRARAPFVYRGPMRSAVRRLKFSGWRALAPRFAPAMAAALGPARAEAVTWVPLAARRRAARGFDQAEVLARAVAPILGLSALALLRRRRETAAQALRSGRERRGALYDAFEVIRPCPSRILLVDDVLTTGATAAACARALRAAGAREVVVLTLARSFGGRLPGRAFDRGGRRE